MDASMKRKVRLANIYIQIYNKRSITIDDLNFLSAHDPECFEKTSQNLIYNIPQSKKLMIKKAAPVPRTREKEKEQALQSTGKNQLEKGATIDVLLENLRKMESHELVVQDVSQEKVRNLLGSLYMEMLFPHNDKYQYFDFCYMDESTFNEKA